MEIPDEIREEILAMLRQAQEEGLFTPEELAEIFVEAVERSAERIAGSVAMRFFFSGFTIGVSIFAIILALVVIFR